MSIQGGPELFSFSRASPGNQNWNCGQRDSQVTVLLTEKATQSFYFSYVQGQRNFVFVPGLRVEWSILNTLAGVSEVL